MGCGMRRLQVSVRLVRHGRIVWRSLEAKDVLSIFLNSDGM